MPNRYGRNGTRVCTCGHFHAAHRWVDGVLGPCDVPGCACQAYLDKRVAARAKREAQFQALLASERKRLSFAYRAQVLVGR